MIIRYLDPWFLKFHIVIPTEVFVKLMCGSKDIDPTLSPNILNTFLGVQEL